MDKKTQQIAAEWIAAYDAAVANEDLAEMTRIVDAVCASPNRPFRRAICKALGL